MCLIQLQLIIVLNTLLLCPLCHFNEYSYGIFSYPYNKSFLSPERFDLMRFGGAHETSDTFEVAYLHGVLSDELKMLDEEREY